MSSGSTTQERLALARTALTSATARTTTRQIHTESLTTGDDVLPADPALRPLLPQGGLRRGSTTLVRSSPALLLALLAPPSTAGHWCAIVGMPQLGLVAAHEAGLVLARTALIPHPGDQLLPVLSALVEGVELIALSDAARLRPGDRQRLAAKARQRGTVLLATDNWPGADLELHTQTGTWSGIAGHGMGHLRTRQTRIRATGCGIAPRGRETTVLLPNQDGRIEPSDWASRTAKPTTARPTRTRRAG